jgi:hypothetical protein
MAMGYLLPVIFSLFRGAFFPEHPVEADAAAEAERVAIVADFMKVLRFM